MSLQEQINIDLKSLFNPDEFGKTITHFFGDKDEPLDVNFFEKTEVVLDSSSSKYEFEGAMAVVPSITLPKDEGVNITEASTFTINGSDYEVISLAPTANIIRVYLGHIQ
jgi:hypothetical protein